MLEDKIKKAINEDLPNQIGRELLARFTSLEETEKLYESLLVRFEALKAQNDTTQKEVYNLRNLQLEEEDIKLKRKDLELDRLKFEISKEILEVKQSEANKRADGVHELVKDMFSNPKSFGTTYRSFSYGNEYNQATNQYEMTKTGETITEDKQG